MPRDNIVLQCTDCKSRNYVTTKNKKTTTDRLELSKFCRRCRKHTDHKETKGRTDAEKGRQGDTATIRLCSPPPFLPIAVSAAHRDILSPVTTSASKTESP